MGHHKILTASLAGLWATTGCYSGLDHASLPDDGGTSQAADDGAASDGTDGHPEPDLEVCAGDDPPSVADARMRRLDKIEYDNTLRDLGLLPEGTSIADSFAGDVVLGAEKRGFIIGGHVDLEVARDLVDAAVTVADMATTDLPGLTGCAPATTAAEDDCARTFIESMGARAFRRHLTDEEVEELFAEFSAARGDLDFRAGIEVALASMLTAPEFLYLIERDPPGTSPGDIVPLDGYALASRLSYFVWDSTPDPELLESARRGDLDGKDGLELEVRRMLDDPRALAAVNRFLREWTFVDELPHATKDADAYGWFTPELAADLRESLLLSLEHGFWEDGSLDGFLAADTMFLNAAIAEAYELPVPEEPGFVEVPVDPAVRPGLLGHPAFHALHAKASRSDPIARGLFVQEQLRCQPLPEPPDDVELDLPPPEPGVSLREQFAQHVADPACAACHQSLDPIGFGLESYDAVGRYRTVDELGNPVDASGELVGVGDGTFEGAAELVELLGQDDAVPRCLATQFFRYALARMEKPSDACTSARLTHHFVESGGDFEELMVSLVLSDSFRYRKVGEK